MKASGRQSQKKDMGKRSNGGEAGETGGDETFMCVSVKSKHLLPVLKAI